MFPIFSYILLGGKCRYCKKKIRPRYLILESLSGLLFVVIAYFMGLRLENLNPEIITEYCFMALYITFIILIAGTDQENEKIYKEINIYGITISIMYMAYLCIIEKTSIYRYGIYLLLYIIILVLDTITLKKMAKSTYLNGILLLLITMAMFSGEFITVMSIIVTLLSIAIYIIIYKIQEDLKAKKLISQFIHK